MPPKTNTNTPNRRKATTKPPNTRKYGPVQAGEVNWIQPEGKPPKAVTAATTMSPEPMDPEPCPVRADGTCSFASSIRPLPSNALTAPIVPSPGGKAQSSNLLKPQVPLAPGVPSPGGGAHSTSLKPQVPLAPRVPSPGGGAPSKPTRKSKAPPAPVVPSSGGRAPPKPTRKPDVRTAQPMSSPGGQLPTTGGMRSLSAITHTLKAQLKPPEIPREPMPAIFPGNQLSSTKINYIADV